MYEPKNFSHLIGTPGFSDQMLNNHFTLYQGYVKNFNALNNALVALEKEEKFGTAEYAELNRRFGWEWNGMRLHELYFGNMAKQGKPLAPDSALAVAIAKEFGSMDAWQKDFTSIGVMRGIGWVILYYDKPADRLFDVWVSEHAENHLAGATPLLVMDMWEHAFMLDYGLKKTDYISAFMKATDWNVIEERFIKVI